MRRLITAYRWCFDEAQPSTRFQQLSRSLPAFCVLLPVLLTSPPVRAADLIPPASLDAAGLTRYWQVAIPLISGESLASIHQADEYIYAISDKAVVYAIEADSGLIRWTQQVDLPGNRVFAPAHRVDASGMRQAVIVTATRVGFYDLRQGDRVEEIRLPFSPSTAGVSDAERFYVGSLNRRLHCYRLSDGLRIWQILTGGPIMTRPQLVGEDLYFASRDGRIYVSKAAVRQKVWIASTGTEIHGDLAIGADMVYAAGVDRYVYAYDRRSGRERWRRQLESPLFTGPLLAGDTLYQESRDGEIYAINPSDGSIRWRHNEPVRFLARGSTRVYLLQANGVGLVVENASGSVDARIAADGADVTLPNTMDETLFVASRGGVLVCIRPRQAQPLQRQELVQANAPAAPSTGPQPPTQPAAELRGPAVPDSIADVIRDPFRSRGGAQPFALPPRTAPPSDTQQP